MAHAKNIFHPAAQKGCLRFMWPKSSGTLMMSISCNWMGKVHARGVAWAWRSMPEVFLFFFLILQELQQLLLPFPRVIYISKRHICWHSPFSSAPCRLTSSKHSDNPKFSVDAKSTQQVAKATLAKADVREAGLLPLPLSFHLSLLGLISPLTQGLNQQAICMLTRLALHGWQWSCAPINPQL